MVSYWYSQVVRRVEKKKNGRVGIKSNTTVFLRNERSAWYGLEITGEYFSKYPDVFLVRTKKYLLGVKLNKTTELDNTFNI